MNELLLYQDDRPSISLLLSCSRNKILAKCALRNLRKRIGVADWECRIVDMLPDDLKGGLPTVEEIEAELGTKGRK